MGYCLTTVKMQPGFNQTLIKTSTGVWSVTYNAENRPVRWECGNTVVTMDFDRMGRRVFYKEEVEGEVVTYHKFVYDNYLCVQKLDALNNNSQMNLFVWDPTESVATRPLFMVANPGNYKFFYTFDGNKNVSELVHFESRNGIAAHYDYAPFGAVTRAVNTSAISARDFSAENPFRFSSEYHDDTLGLVYYNYRHYNPIDGRWCGRDRIEPINELNAYKLYVSCVMGIDQLGQNSMPSYNRPIAGLSLLEMIDNLFGFLDERFHTLNALKNQGCKRCEDAQPRNTPKISNVSEIRRCPLKYCCVILFREYRYGGAVTSHYSFVDAYIDEKPCDRVGTLLPKNVGFTTMPWEVYL